MRSIYNNILFSLINRGTSTANENTEAPSHTAHLLVFGYNQSTGGGCNAGHMETKQKDRILPIT